MSYLLLNVSTNRIYSPHWTVRCQIRHRFEMNCQVDRYEHFRHLFAFNQDPKATISLSGHLRCVQRWLHYRTKTVFLRSRRETSNPNAFSHSGWYVQVDVNQLPKLNTCLSHCLSYTLFFLVNAIFLTHFIMSSHFKYFYSVTSYLLEFEMWYNFSILDRSSCCDYRNLILLSSTRIFIQFPGVDLCLSIEYWCEIERKRLALNLDSAHRVNF